MNGCVMIVGSSWNNVAKNCLGLYQVHKRPSMITLIVFCWLWRLLTPLRPCLKHFSIIDFFCRHTHIHTDTKALLYPCCACTCGVIPRVTPTPLYLYPIPCVYHMRLHNFCVEKLGGEHFRKSMRWMVAFLFTKVLPNLRLAACNPEPIHTTKGSRCSCKNLR